MTDPTPTDAPLTPFRIVGFTTRRTTIAAGTPDAYQVPGGSCWHCSQAIAYCVQIRNTTTGEIVEVGTTCAERVGLDAAELKEYLADKFWEQREQARQGREAAARWRRERQEELRTHWFGPHGSQGRFLSGCRCIPCVDDGAPHGTRHRAIGGECRCLVCIDTLLEDPNTEVWDRACIVDLATGQLADARLVDTRYGMRWCINDGATWLGYGPARRGTHAKHGYVQAKVPTLCERRRGRDGSYLVDLAPLGHPIVDWWGEPTPRPDHTQGVG